nr:hypothetical protein [uncultured Acetatifactor sp.]
MEEEHSNGRRAFQWKKSIPMEEEHSNGRRAFQWKKGIPNETHRKAAK